LGSVSADLTTAQEVITTLVRREKEINTLLAKTTITAAEKA
jgi:hypothetical protein